ncbi:hypothetical protein TrST_g12907 [Triparma strigata]|uniref:Uncharacterized protein n=1 Tax=Triparma strigata TaxID=1606541 RepID=A0A9W7EIN5_9STRA|nr:hypothetical protein TrST_g12907 [Triparma strigata]
MANYRAIFYKRSQGLADENSNTGTIFTYTEASKFPTPKKNSSKPKLNNSDYYATSFEAEARQAPVALPPVPLKYSIISAAKEHKGKKEDDDVDLKENESYTDYDGAKAMRSGKRPFKGEGRTCRSSPYPKWFYN